MEEVKVHNKINAITVVVVSNLPFWFVKKSQDDNDDNDSIDDRRGHILYESN